MSNRQNYCNTNVVLLRLGLSEVLHKTLTTDRERPYTDAPFVILVSLGVLKSSQQIGGDPNL